MDCDPIAGMARLAQNESLPAALRARMFAELAGYVAPRRKAVEVSGPGGSSLAPTVTFKLAALSTEEITKLRDLLKKAGVGDGRG